MFRYRKNFRNYQKHLDVSTCPFCETLDKNRVIQETAHSYVIQNIFGYDVWEMRSVTDHLMVIPKHHVAGFADLDEEEKLDVISLLGNYQANGYNVYARSTGSNLLTVPAHQHTHLIKISPRRSALLLAISRPYLLLKLGGKSE